MKSVMEMPFFKYYLLHQGHMHFGCITAGDEVIHRIEDPFQFYKALGYTAKMKAIGIAPEEYVWEEYYVSNAPRTISCLQARIVGYLQKHSKLFRKKYGGAYVPSIKPKSGSTSHPLPLVASFQPPL